MATKKSKPNPKSKPNNSTRKPTTLAELAYDYIEWAKTNRPEKVWKRQERILREDVLPAIGKLPLSAEIFETLMVSPLTLSPDKEKNGLRAINVATAIVNWAVKERSNLFLTAREEVRRD